MRLAMLLFAVLSTSAWAQKPKVEILNPVDRIVPSGSASIQVRASNVKVVRVYVDGLYQGRRYYPNPDSGKTATLKFLVQFPSVAKKGRYTIRAEGEDANGDPFEAVEVHVSPTRDRDVQTELEVTAPFIVTAPPAARFTTDTSVPPSSSSRRIVITPATADTTPGGKVKLKAEVFEGDTLIKGATPTLSAPTGGTFDGTTFCAPGAVGRYKVVATYGDAIASARIDVGTPYSLEVRSWGIHALRVIGGRFPAGTVHVDPNQRPSTTLTMVVTGEDKGKELTLTIEGLDADSEVIATKVVKVSVR